MYISDKRISLRRLPCRWRYGTVIRYDVILTHIVEFFSYATYLLLFSFSTPTIRKITVRSWVIAMKSSGPLTSFGLAPRRRRRASRNPLAGHSLSQCPKIIHHRTQRRAEIGSGIISSGRIKDEPRRI